jgi:uncharacterized protein (TIGR02687 family)
LDAKSVMQGETSQLRFYETYIEPAKEKTVVFISDALRYEVARELLEKLNSDPNCNATMKHMIAALPAYTQLGMAVLLPHKSLEIRADGDVLVDGNPSDGTDKRAAILKAKLPDSRCVQAADLPQGNEGLRKIFNDMDAVYVFHDLIDKRGSSSDNGVLSACPETVNYLYYIINRLSDGANTCRFVVTADHGFLYKRDKFTESDKINLGGLKNAITNRRFIISEEAVDAEGVASAPLADIIGGEDGRVVSWPIGANVFKTQGGLNYVHGGASPQEMILPVITVKTRKGRIATTSAKIALVSTVKKITNLITQLDFMQQEPVSIQQKPVSDKNEPIVEPAEYKIYFLSEDNEKISNEHIYSADKSEKDPNKRMFRLRFTFKSKKYDTAKKHWLLAVDADSGVELFRHQVLMDIAFSDDIGFDL